MSSEQGETTTPPNLGADVEGYAQRRANELGLQWSQITEAHRTAIRDTIWLELNWHD